jgi:hypothetical protein
MGIPVKTALGGILATLILTTSITTAKEPKATAAQKAGDTKATSSSAANLPEGIDPKQTSEDPAYGFTQKNPVRLGSRDEFGGPAMSEVFLRHLRDGQFKPFTFERDGSLGGNPDGHILDLYTLVDSAGKKYQIYIDMYHPEISPLTCKAPKGMFLWK